MKFRFRKKKSKLPAIFDVNFYIENHRELIDGQDPYKHYCNSGPSSIHIHCLIR